MTAWLKTKNMFTRWKSFFRYVQWTFQWKLSKWKQKYLKYNIRKYTINFSQKLAKNTNKKIAELLTNRKHFSKYKENYVDNIDDKVCKHQLDAIYEERAKGIKISCKCSWYRLGEKFTKIFLNLQKHRAIQSQIHPDFINQNEITYHVEITYHIFSFYQSLFWRKVQNQADKM